MGWRRRGGVGAYLRRGALHLDRLQRTQPGQTGIGRLPLQLLLLLLHLHLYLHLLLALLLLLLLLHELALLLKLVNLGDHGQQRLPQRVAPSDQPQLELQLRKRRRRGQVSALQRGAGAAATARREGV